MSEPDFVLPAKMGLFGKFAEWLGFKKEAANVIVIGLDNSGKTSILNHLKNEDQKSLDIVPTVGFNVDKLKVNSLSITAFDMSGQGRYRTLWEQYYRDCHGVIFVVDSSDKLRMVVARDELEQMLSHPDICKRRVPVLFFANKMDLRDAVSSVKVSSLMGLDSIKDNPWQICTSNALSGEGLHEGIDWLTGQMKDSLAQRRK